MNLVAGVTSFSVPVRFDASLARSEDTVCQMEDQGQGNLAVVLRRNLAISWCLRTVDTLLLALRVWEVRNFELWEQSRRAKEVPAQDQVVEGEMDCFRDLLAR